jgi:hypothetical protein
MDPLTYVLFFFVAWGAMIGMIGIVVRRQTLRELAYRPCPRCGKPNVWPSGYCRYCGVPLPGAPEPGSARLVAAAPAPE